MAMADAAISREVPTTNASGFTVPSEAVVPGPIEDHILLHGGAGPDGDTEVGRRQAGEENLKTCFTGGHARDAIITIGIGECFQIGAVDLQAGAFQVLARTGVLDATFDDSRCATFSGVGRSAGRNRPFIAGNGECAARLVKDAGQSRVREQSRQSITNTELAPHRSGPDSTHFLRGCF